MTTSKSGWAQKAPKAFAKMQRMLEQGRGPTEISDRTGIPMCTVSRYKCKIKKGSGMVGVRSDSWQIKNPPAWRLMLKMLADGESFRAIGEATGIPSQTVRTHCSKYGRGDNKLEVIESRMPEANAVLYGAFVSTQ